MIARLFYGDNIDLTHNLWGVSFFEQTAFLSSRTLCEGSVF